MLPPLVVVDVVVVDKESTVERVLLVDDATGGGVAMAKSLHWYNLFT